MPSGDRDRVVDQLLRASAGDGLAGPGPGCVDAETFAAWHDGGLDAHQARAVEGHLATCARCQSLAAAFARADIVPASAPARAAWGLRWLVPVGIAAAAAIAVWAVIPREPSRPAADQKVAMNERPPSSAGQIPPAEPLARAEDVVSPMTAIRPAEPARAASAGVAADVPAAPPAREDTAASKGEARSSLGREGSTVMPAPSGPSAAPAPPPPPATAVADPPKAPAAAAPERPGRSESAVVTAEAPLIQAQSGERSFAVSSAQTENLPISRGNFAGVTAKVPEPVPADAPSRNTRVGGAGQTNAMLDGVSAMDVGASTAVVAEFTSASLAVGARAGGVAGGTAVPSPSTPMPPTRWRVLADGRVQRSVSGGTSWDVIALDSSTRVTGGVAPSQMVCWLIGPGGVVLRTTDRLHFERLAFPESVDLIVIQATSELAATVITRDSRALATADGGKTWHAAGR